MSRVAPRVGQDGKVKSKKRDWTSRTSDDEFKERCPCWEVSLLDQQMGKSSFQKKMSLVRVQLVVKELNSSQLPDSLLISVDVASAE